MNQENCRFCYRKLPIKSLIDFDKMPKSAQFLPDKNEIVSERAMPLNIYQCDGCGLVQHTNHIVSYYREVIRAVGISEEIKAFRRDQFKSFFDEFELKEKSSIELGCGKGDYLELLSECADGVYGTEYGSESVKACEDKGLKVEKTFLEKEDQVLANGPFDAFFSFNFLEHIPNLNEYLTCIHHNLNDGAVGLVEVPNFDMMIKENLFSEFISDHIYYFTKESLRLVLERNGFEIISCEEVWYDYILSAKVRKKKLTDLSGFIVQKEKLEKQILEYMTRFGEKQVAIWGAGHQSLALMAMFELGNVTKYVIDSAPFKQEKYTPGSHIPILPPSIIEEDKPAGILVMAAAYSDEVAKIIKEKYPDDISIAIGRAEEIEVVR